MEYLSIAIKRFFSYTLVFIVIFALAFGVLTEATLAQTNQPQSGQGATFVNGQTGNNQEQSLTLSEQGAINGIAGCAASVVGGVVSQVTLGIFQRSDIDSQMKVPTTDNQNTARAGGSTGWPPSLDSIGYCIINAVIEMIAQATIDWINSGFDGNPAFVEDPEKFFGDIAETETANFLHELVDKTTGIDICEPFRLEIVTGLSGGQNRNQFARQARCTFDQMGEALKGSGVDFVYEDYISGDADYSGSLDAWWNITQNDQNNQIGAYFLAQKELGERLAVKGNIATLDLTMGSGFLSFKKCSKDSTVQNEDGTSRKVKGICGITTPGSVIEEQLNNRLSSGNNRLILADKFDQVISALVNQLIKTALNEVLTSDE